MLLPWSLAAARLAAVLACLLALPVAAAQAAPAACRPTAASLLPPSGVWFGASLDWSRTSVAAYARRLGHVPAASVSFAPFPMTAAEGRNLDLTADQVRAGGGMLLLTLEPQRGLARVTRAAATALGKRLGRYNRSGVGVLVRFAHEMNGSWYPWAQQPAAYVAAFRRVAQEVHRRAPASAMLWAPNYGGGYPFTGGRHQAPAGSADGTRLDTTGDGAVTQADDPYRPTTPATTSSTGSA